MTKHSVSIADTQLTACLMSKISSILMNSYEKEFSISHFVAIHCDCQEHNPMLNEFLTVVHILSPFLCKVTVVVTAESLMWDLKLCHPRCVRSIIQSCGVYISIYIYSHEHNNMTISSNI